MANPELIFLLNGNSMFSIHDAKAAYCFVHTYIIRCTMPAIPKSYLKESLCDNALLNTYRIRQVGLAQ